MHILGSSTDRDNGYRLSMELSEVMRTTFSCRQWTDEPVDDATIYRILDNARFAPNGGNRQGWHVTVVKDRAIREQFKPLIKPATNQYVAQVAPERPRGTPSFPLRSTLQQNARSTKTFPASMKWLKHLLCS